MEGAPEKTQPQPAEFVFDEYEEMVRRKERPTPESSSRLSEDAVRSHHGDIAGRGSALLSEQRLEPVKDDGTSPSLITSAADG